MKLLPTISETRPLANIVVTGLKPYPAYRCNALSWLGKFPTHWKIKRVKTILRERSEKGYPNELLLAATQSKGVVRKEQYENRTVLALKDLHLLKLVCVGDFVISLRSFQGGIEYAREQGIISPAYTILYAEDPRNHRYLAHLFKSKPYIENLGLFVTGIRQGQNIDYEKLGRSGLPLPPLPEQTAIVRYLDYFDRRIRRYIRAKEKLIKLLEEQKQVVIHRAVTRGLDPDVPLKPSGVEWLGEMPEHWEVRRLKYLLYERDIRSIDGTEQLLRVSQYTGVTERKNECGTDKPDTRAASLVNYKCVSPNELVVNIMLAWNGSMGISRFQGIVSPAYCVYRFNNIAVSWYFHNLLRSPRYKARIKAVSTGIVESRLRLYTDDLYRLDGLLPPLPEQTAIVEYLDKTTANLDTAIARTRRGIELLQEYRTRLIADVVTGKLDVREAASQLPNETDKPELPDEDNGLTDPEEETVEVLEH